MLLQKFLFIIVYNLFQTVSHTSCEGGSSLAFAIDDTRSMKDVIDQVKRETKAIMRMVFTKKSSEIKNMVLVTINDPDVLVRANTRSARRFLQALNDVHIHTNINNKDCAEMVMTGIGKALVVSRPESYIYVFTDASAKDFYRVEQIKRLCQQKQSQVVIVLTGVCKYVPKRWHAVYYDVAKACSGQVFYVNKLEVHTVLKTIEVLLEGRTSILKWINVPKSDTYVPVKFDIDEKAEYALISTSGINVQLRITSTDDLHGPVPVQKVTMWNKNAKVVKIIDPQPGTYYVWVKGNSTVSIVIYGRTDFTFDYGFSTHQASTMSDTSKQPIKGLKQYLTLNVTDHDQSVDIKTVSILDINNNDNVIDTLTLKKTGGNIYITEPFVSPDTTFRIAVKGEIKKTGQIIIRNSRTNIDPQPPQDPIPKSAPEVSIEQGIKYYVEYGSNMTLTCNVNGHPSPKIEWYKSNGELLSFESSVIEDPRFVSYLELRNIQQNNTYVCKSSNEMGKGTDKQIEVVVRPVFKEFDIPEAIYNVMYAGDLKIPCKITSHLPIKIKWFKAGKELSDYSEVHSISTNRLELTLKSMSIEMQGTYTCETTLVSDPTVKKIYNTNVEIPGLARPIIHTIERNVTFIKGNTIKIECKTVQGYPKPQIRWFKKNADSYVPLAVGNIDVLTERSALLEHAGQYRCDATNDIGIDTAIFDVTVSSIPTITISKTDLSVSYDSSVELICEVKAYPLNNVEWIDGTNSIIKSKFTKLSEYSFLNKLNLHNVRKSGVYVCKASNNLGFDDKSVKVTVDSPFDVKDNVTAVYNAPYGEDLKIPCKVTSHFPMIVTWFKNGEKLSDNSDVHTTSIDGSELTLKSMNIEMQGSYTCETTLTSDPSVKTTVNIDVKIPGLARPIIQPTKRIINVTKGDKIEIQCKTEQGYPKPQVKWFKENSESYVPLSVGNIEVLTEKNALLEHAGQYRCDATNAVGNDIAIFDVTVSSTPAITIAKTDINVSYDSSVELICEVKAYPLNTIEWIGGTKSVIKSKFTKLSEYEFVNKLNLHNVRKSGVYVCKASNNLGFDDKSVKVTVDSPFEVKDNVTAVFNAPYGENLKIPCKVTSNFPMIVTWFKNGKKLSDHSEIHSISIDGSELTLKSMNIEMQGSYTCKTTLTSDPSVKTTMNIDVKIPGLDRPRIQPTKRIINVRKGDKVELQCNVRGYPKPHIRWFKKKADSFVPLSVGNIEVLTERSALLEHAGQYTCDATNAVGNDTAIFDLTVSNTPEITIAKRDINVSYDSNVELICEVKAYPLNTIEWTDGTKSILKSKITKLSEYEYVNKLNLYNVRKSCVYVCKATNNLGSADESVKLTVDSPFEVHDNVTVVYYALYGENLKIPCKVSSHFPMKVRWFKDGVVLSDHSEIHYISTDGSELTLKSMNVTMQGSYACETTLSSDPTVKTTMTKDVKIPGLARPRIQPTMRIINVTKGDKIEIQCKTEQGYPKPQIRWFKKNADSYVPLAVGNIDVLTERSALLEHAGQYRCDATNAVGNDTAVLDLTVSSTPEITIVKTAKNVAYDSSFELICEVKAYPLDSIEWTDGTKSILRSEISQPSEYQYVNKLNLHNVRKNGVYVCKASNNLGSADKSVQVTVDSPFEVQDNVTTAVYNAPYGENLKIPCKVTSHFPTKVRWFKDGEELSDHSEEHSISIDGSELTLKSMKVTMQGSYTCETTLTSDPTVKTTMKKDVKIPGLARPRLQPTKTILNVTKGDKIEIQCITAQGYPKPQIRWFKRNADSYVPLSVGNIEKLTVHNASFEYVGQYKCEAFNDIGIDTAIFDVTVSGSPEISVAETYINIPYGSNVELICKVKAYPLNSISWTDQSNLKFDSMVTNISEYAYVNKLNLKNARRSAIYVCKASNKLAFVKKYVNVTVTSPFEVKQHISGTTGIYYGTSDSLRCDIRSSNPIIINWFIQKKGVKSGRTIIRSSNKYNVSVDGVTLTINSMTLDKEAKYICEASLKSVPSERLIFSTDVSVAGLRKPEIISPTTISNGKNFTAVCRTKGVPPPIVSWKFKPKGSEIFQTIPGAGEELNNLHMEQKNKGVYKCIAKNEIGEIDHDFDGIGQEHPVIMNVDTEYFGIEGDLVLKIPCNVTGSPTPTIIWKKDGNIINGDTKYSFKGTALYVNNPVPSDSSEDYTCEAENILGNDLKTFHVEIADIEGDKNFDGETYDIFAEERKPIIIKCNLTEAERGPVRWFLDGTLTNQTKSTYTIESVGKQHEANFTCRVDTENGGKSETYVLNIGFSPEFDNGDTLITVEWKDDTQKLSCSARSQPLPKYEWIFNGKLQADVSAEKLITYWGTYTCKASNVHGSIRKNFTVGATGCLITKYTSMTNQPLVSDLVAPMWLHSASNSYIKLSKHETIKLSCPTNGFKVLPSEKEIIAECISEETFAVSGNTYKFSELECNSKVEPTIQHTGVQCSGNGTELIRVGYTVNGFLDVYDVCYDKNWNAPLFSNASITRIGNGVNVTEFEWSFSPEARYVTPGDWKADGSCKCCYTKGQLVNVNEVPFGPAQAAVFIEDMNSVPIWNPQCDGSTRITWQYYDIEIKSSSNLYEEWFMWTGASEYVEKDSGLVPRLLWKVIKGDGEFSVMVFVNEKTPTTTADLRCTDLCVPWVEIEDNFFYCCALEEFTEKFKVPIETFQNHVSKPSEHNVLG